jgi:hypothetical protein
MEAPSPHLRGRQVALLIFKTARSSRRARRDGRSRSRKSAAGDPERVSRGAPSQAYCGRRPAKDRTAGSVHTRLRRLLRQFRHPAKGADAPIVLRYPEQSVMWLRRSSDRLRGLAYPRWAELVPREFLECRAIRFTDGVRPPLPALAKTMSRLPNARTASAAALHSRSRFVEATDSISAASRDVVPADIPPDRPLRPAKHSPQPYAPWRRQERTLLAKAVDPSQISNVSPI